MIHSVKLYAQSLALEYNGSGEVVSIIEWGYSVTKTFSYETNWYIGTIARENWSSIHVEFFTVDGVGIFADGHDNFSVTQSIGYRLVVLIPIYSCTKCFAQCTEWNHGSPCAVYIRSSITFDDLVVYNILGGADGHNHSAISIDISITNGVVECACIGVTVIVYGNNHFHSSRLVSIKYDFTFTILNILIIYCESYNCIFIRLIYYKSANFTFNRFYNVVIFIYNRYIDNVVFTCRTFSWVECESIGVIGINNRQSFLNEFFIVCIQGANSDCRTKQNLMFYSIRLSPETTDGSILIFDCFGITIEAILYIVSLNFQAIFVNVFCYNINSLTKHYFVRDAIPVFSNVIIASIFSLHVDNNILNSTKLRSSESYINILFAQESYTYFIFTRGEITLLIATTNISQSVVAAIPIKDEILRIEGRLVASSKNG